MTEPIGLMLADDLMWTSRITGTAQALGIRLLVAQTAARLKELAQEHAPACIILDLGLREANPLELAPALRAAVASPLRIVAYGAHVDAATLKAARDAGCDPVVSRGKMAESLPELLRAWFGKAQTNDG